jgi:hypothetical protein
MHKEEVELEDLELSPGAAQLLLEMKSSNN